MDKHHKAKIVPEISTKSKLRDEKVTSAREKTRKARDEAEAARQEAKAAREDVTLYSQKIEKIENEIKSLKQECRSSVKYEEKIQDANDSKKVRNQIKFSNFLNNWLFTELHFNLLYLPNNFFTEMESAT